MSDKGKPYNLKRHGRDTVVAHIQDGRDAKRAVGAEGAEGSGARWLPLYYFTPTVAIAATAYAIPQEGEWSIVPSQTEEPWKQLEGWVGKWKPVMPAMLVGGPDIRESPTLPGSASTVPRYSDGSDPQLAYHGYRVYIYLGNPDDQGDPGDTGPNDDHGEVKGLWTRISADEAPGRPPVYDRPADDSAGAQDAGVAARGGPSTLCGGP